MNITFELYSGNHNWVTHFQPLRVGDAVLLLTLTTIFISKVAT